MEIYHKIIPPNTYNIVEKSFKMCKGGLKSIAVIVIVIGMIQVIPKL